MRRLFRRLLLGFVLLSVVSVLAGYFYLRSSLPLTAGSVTVPGLAAQATIVRDARGVPTIRAPSERDAYFALGFAHAQDRLWQMEQMRRAGAGRLSEILGARALATDRFMRTLGLYRLAEANLAQLSDDARGALEAYARGVNGFLAVRKGALPPEFLLLGAAPESWRPADSLVFGRIMAMRLAGNWREELLRGRLQDLLPQERIDDLWASRPDVPLAAIPDLLQPTLASNAWALDGARTTTSKPILANDPHLGYEMPILWYLARIETPTLSIAGATVPGVPFHLLGHNRNLAWGITTTHGDTMDLFVERPIDKDRYETPQGPEEFGKRTEIIKVKDAPDEELVVRTSRHGPILSDVLGELAGGKVLALSAAALREDDRTGEAIYRMTRAADWNAFREALRDFHSPQQNIIYADREGVIALTVAGRVPKRRAGDGTVPLPGWTGENGWTGLLPVDVLPQFVAPPDGTLVNANNRPVGEDYPHLLGVHWPEAYRAERIEDVLKAKPRHSPADSLALQQDVVSRDALQLLPLLLPRLPKGDRRIDEASRLLAAWDGRMKRDRPEPLLFSAWMLALQAGLSGERLTAQPLGMVAVRPYFLARILQQPDSAWCPGGCDAIVAKSLLEALDGLSDRHGGTMSEWRWGEAHKVRFEHSIFRFVPGLSALLAVEMETDGGDFTVNRASTDPRGEDPFRNRHGAGFRAVYDLADLAASRFVIATGQSGNPLSPHWSDLAELWRDGGSLAFGAEAADTLVLEPAR